MFVYMCGKTERERERDKESDPVGRGNLDACVTHTHTLVDFFFLFLLLGHTMWHVGLSLTKDGTWPPILGVWSLNHWTTREAPHLLI